MAECDIDAQIEALREEHQIDIAAEHAESLQIIMATQAVQVAKHAKLAADFLGENQSILANWKEYLDNNLELSTMKVIHLVQTTGSFNYSTIACSESKMKPIFDKIQSNLTESFEWINQDFLSDGSKQEWEKSFSNLLCLMMQIAKSSDVRAGLLEKHESELNKFFGTVNILCDRKWKAVKQAVQSSNAAAERMKHFQISAEIVNSANMRQDAAEEKRAKMETLDKLLQSKRAVLEGKASMLRFQLQSSHLRIQEIQSKIQMDQLKVLMYDRGAEDDNITYFLDHFGFVLPSDPCYTEDCNICRERDPLSDDIPVRASRCGHIFGLECILEWLYTENDNMDYNTSCPMCRRGLLD